MKTIWKFQLVGEQPVEMPIGAQILTLGVQFEFPCLWALVDPTARKEWRHFKLYATGAAMPAEPGVYRGTLGLKGGGLVVHVFEPHPVPVHG